MAQVLFTDMMVRKLVPIGRDRFEVWDGRVPGFGLRVAPTGTKTFILVYRHRGRTRRLTLGRYPFLSLADARDKAVMALQAVTRGEDPALDAAATDGVTFQFDAVLDQFVTRHCRVRNKPATARETERLLRKHFVAAWSKRDIRDISPSHINAVLDGLVAAGKPSEANHALGAIKTLFAWCVERDLLNVSPGMKVRKPAKHGARSRVLNDDELLAVWRAFVADGYPFGTMGMLLLLTGQRRGEVTQMRWAQIDFAHSTWTIPAELAKNNHAHVLPLVTPAIAVLKAVPRLSDARVFPARSNDANAISGFTRAKLRFDTVSGVTGWTLHDLRRTVATGLAKLGVAPHVIERILNHVSGTFGGVAGIYNRFQYVEEMRAALEVWAAHIERLTANSIAR